MENTEKRFSKPQDIELEFTQIENHTHTHTHTHTQEQGLRDLGGNNKRSNICITG